MSEEWDALLILDGCRFDMFEEQTEMEGTLSSRNSLGSNTAEFLERNFEDAEHYDTIYVTGNPIHRVDEWCSVDLDAVFYKIEDVWEDSWDETVNTVRPGPVKNRIADIHAAHPNKRIIGHFIQPHQPFITSTGEQLTEAGMRGRDVYLNRDSTSGKKIWEQLEDGTVSKELVWQTYRENLDLVLPHVRALCERLDGKTVITSDHGNLVDEIAWPFLRKRYGHPRGIHTRQLVTVPWLELGFDTRREIQSEVPVTDPGAVDEQERIERLNHLGYR
ncbi:hypothetical protein [Salinigranum halophilum]|uniref:hypothetical protein n=1 Tax=Salinigranum halophilum TaxID=2565931 RepID=UPI0010A796D1|nr:hypothetical protein [Salinigranum halophilum]